MASIQKDEFGHDLTGVKCSYIHIHLFLTYQKAARTAALSAVMLKISGYFSHFEEVAKPLLVSRGIRTSATRGRKGTIVRAEYTSHLLFTLQHTAKKQQLFAKKAGHRKQVYKQVLSMALHNRIRNSLSIRL